MTNQWLPMGDEPRSGQSFLVYCPDNKSQYLVARNAFGELCVFGGGGSLLFHTPSHWRPLAAFPDEPTPEPIRALIDHITKAGHIYEYEPIFERARDAVKAEPEDDSTTSEAICVVCGAQRNI